MHKVQKGCCIYTGKTSACAKGLTSAVFDIVLTLLKKNVNFDFIMKKWIILFFLHPIWLFSQDCTIDGLYDCILNEDTSCIGEIIKNKNLKKIYCVEERHRVLHFSILNNKNISFAYMLGFSDKDQDVFKGCLITSIIIGNDIALEMIMEKFKHFKIKQKIIHKYFVESILTYDAFKSDKGIERNAFVKSMSFYNIFVLLEQNRYTSKESIEQYCRGNLQESDKKIVDAYINLN